MVRFGYLVYQMEECTITIIETYMQHLGTVPSTMPVLLHAVRCIF